MTVNYPFKGLAIGRGFRFHGCDRTYVKVGEDAYRHVLDHVSVLAGSLSPKFVDLCFSETNPDVVHVTPVNIEMFLRHTQKQPMRGLGDPDRDLAGAVHEMCRSVAAATMNSMVHDESFRKFQATRRMSDHREGNISWCGLPIEYRAMDGTRLWITLGSEGDWYTIIGNREHRSMDLTEVERILWQWALDEGIITLEH